MKSAGCTLTLRHDASMSCVVDLTLDDPGRRTWVRADSPRHRLRLGPTSGSWRVNVYDDGDTVLLLRDDASGLVVAGLAAVPEDFLDRVSCARSLSGGGNLTAPTVNIVYTIWWACS